MLLATNVVDSEMSGCQESGGLGKGAVQTPSERNEARRPSSSAAIASLRTIAGNCWKGNKMATENDR
jgi:hypothetical protein